MKGDQAQQKNREVFHSVDNFELSLLLEETTLTFQILNVVNTDLFRLELTSKVLQADHILAFLFVDPTELFQYLAENKRCIAISKIGVVQFTVTVIGNTKSKTLFIPTQKVEVSDRELMTKSLRFLHQSHREIKELREKINKNGNMNVSSKFQDSKLVAFYSRSSQKYLDGRQYEDTVLMTNRKPQGDKYLNWRVENLGGGIVAIRSQSSGFYLDGRQQNNSVVLVTNRYPLNDAYLQWKIIPSGQDDWVILESVSSKCYLDGRNYEDEALVTNRPWQGDKVFYFRIITM